MGAGAAFTDAFETEIINYFLRNQAITFTRPASPYLALATAATESSFTEVSGNAYARQACALAAGGASSGTVTFPTATPSGWGALTHWGLWDAVTVGNRFAGARLVAAIAITNSLANPTVVTATSHGLSTGDYVIITGSNSTPSIDGAWQVTYLNANTFSIPVNCSGAGTTGNVYVPTTVTVNANEKIEFATGVVSLSID